jgi:PKHD-type hydroxylase
MTNENLDLSNQDNSFTNDITLITPVASLEIVSINLTEFLSAEQCTQILDKCIEELWLPVGVVGDNTKFHASRRQKLRGEVDGFPFMNIREITKNANDVIYDFNLLGIIDQDFPQVFKYATKDFYNWHIELSPITPSRKITFIINLSDPATYTGGDIEFLNVDAGNTKTNQQGSCLTFPSFMPWRLTPVTSGVKHIIIGHVHGALFK